MLGRPKTACDKCSAQKLRCLGQKPSCQRCLRLRRPCLYSRNPGTEDAGTGASLPPRVSEKTYLGIPSALIGPLVDTYFVNVYNASLLLHRPTFTNALAENAVRPETLLSICSVAAKFHRDTNGHLSLLDNGLCHEWAERASRLAFQEAQMPREENIVALLTLALFWYSMGEFRRSSMHECCATNTAVILGLLTEIKGKKNTLEAEIRRRRFWACYLLCAFASETLLARSPTEQMLNLSLPCREEDYQLGSARDLVSLKSKQSNGSVHGELVKAMTLWSEVYLLVRKSEPNWAQRLASIQALDGRIHEWWSKMHPSLQISLAEILSNDLPNLLPVHIIYHSCLCALHASIVPLFSWSTAEGAPPYAQQLSAQSALHHANAISSLLGAAQQAQCDPARMSSFIGYAAYCACAVQIPFLWCTKPEVKQRAHANLLINLGNIQGVSKHWKFIELLGRNVRWLYETHARHPVDLGDEPINMDPTSLNRTQVKAARARLSILTHNRIIIGEEGAVAKQTEDVGELGIEDSSLSDERNAVDLMADHYDDQLFGSLNPLMAGAFPLFDDPVFFDPDFSMAFPDGAADANQNELLGVWIGDLMKEGA